MTQSGTRLDGCVKACADWPRVGFIILTSLLEDWSGFRKADDLHPAIVEMSTCLWHDTTYGPTNRFLTPSAEYVPQDRLQPL